MAKTRATEYNLVILGEMEVGKSSIVLQYTRKLFDEEYHPTVAEDLHRSENVTIDSEPCELEILDTGGDPAYHDCREQGFMLVYSITNKATFEALRQSVESLTAFKGDTNIPLVVVGNKRDLEEQREVKVSEGKNFAISIGADFLETSAKLNKHIDESFGLLIQQCRRKEPEPVVSNLSRKAIVKGKAEKQQKKAAAKLQAKTADAEAAITEKIRDHEASADETPEKKKKKKCVVS